MTYYRAWFTLRYDRQYGAMGGETPISFSACKVYADTYGITGVAFDKFVRLVREEMDMEHLLIVAERMKAEQDKRERERE